MNYNQRFEEIIKEVNEIDKKHINEIEQEINKIRESKAGPGEYTPIDYEKLQMCNKILSAIDKMRGYLWKIEEIAAKFIVLP